jgi:hypothetical protein
MKHVAPLALACVALHAGAGPARADFTAFLGLTPTTDVRRAQGVAVGSGLFVVGFEFEYAQIVDSEDGTAPSLTTGSGNLLLQTPMFDNGLQFYGTTGLGLYRESLGAAHQETQVAANVGGGVKIRLAGPLRVRLDYRLFTLRGSPLISRPQRLYAGLNVGF